MSLNNYVVVEWDGDLQSTDFLFVEKGEAEDCQVRLTMSEWIDRGSPMEITVLFEAMTPLAPQQGINPPVNGAGADSTTEGRA